MRETSEAFNEAIFPAKMKQVALGITIIITISCLLLQVDVQVKAWFHMRVPQRESKGKARSGRRGVWHKMPL